MRPLIFLSVRTILNGIRRAFKSPVRMIGILIVTAYWASFLFTRGFTGRGLNQKLPDSLKFDLPAGDILFAAFFAGFLLIVLVRSLVMFVPPGWYRPADVDVLFPTPISPKFVMIHRFVSDYLFTLFMPLLLALFFGRRGMDGLQLVIRELPDPGAAKYLGISLLLAFFLVSLFAVALSYAVGIVINRDTPNSRLLKKAAGLAVALIFAGIILSSVRAMMSEAPLESLVVMANDTVTRILFFPATAAADLTTAPLQGDWTQAALAIAVLILGSAILMGFALSQSSYLYDMATQRSVPAAQRREMTRGGDTSLVWVAAAREGKIKPRRNRYVSALRWEGAFALLWRDLVQVARFAPITMVLFVVLLAGCAWLSVMQPETAQSLFQAQSVVFTVLIPFMVPAMVQSGFQATLRHCDVLKPLPFSMVTLSLFESAGKAIGAIVISVLVAVLHLVLSPGDWDRALAMAIGLPPICLFSSSVMWIVVLLFPDISDPAQRTLRGLALIAGYAAIVAPALIVLVPGMLLKVPVLLLAVFVAATYIGLTRVAAGVASPILKRFNLSE